MTLRVTLADARRFHFCSRGAREFCERNGIDWLTFVQEGVEIELHRDISDPMWQTLIRDIEARNGR